jgi:hypothetical protein
VTLLGSKSTVTLFRFRVAGSSGVRTMMTMLDTTLLMHLSRWDMYLGSWHTMRQLSCPKPIISWCSTFLTDRTIALSCNGQTDQQCPVSTSIPQGPPASPVLFLLYLRPLFDALNTTHPDVWCPSYMDDVALVAQGCTRAGNVRRLEAGARTAFQWAQDNAVAFDDSKSEMLHFHRSR